MTFLQIPARPHESCKREMDASDWGGGSCPCGKRGRRGHVECARLQARRTPRPARASGAVSTPTNRPSAGKPSPNKLCTSCHGPDLSGGEAGPTLVGLEFLGNWTNLTLGDFFDRVHATMPADAPGTLTPQQTSDVAAYVLKLNKYPAGQDRASDRSGALKGIKIEGQPLTNEKYRRRQYRRPRVH